MSRSWIFLRGLGRHSIHWGDFVSQFQKCFPGDKVELLDLRGNGSLAHSPSLTNIADNVRDLRARSQLLKESGHVYLLSISMGAMAAVEWAHQSPEEIEGLIAINTSDRGSSNFFERLRPQNYQKMLRLLLTAPSPLRREEEILKITVNDPARRGDWASVFAQAPETSSKNWVRQLRAAGTYHFPENKPKTEVLLLASRQDHLVNPVCTQNIAEMWGLTAHLHPTAGHDLPLEDGAWICDEIRKWLQGIEV